MVQFQKRHLPAFALRPLCEQLLLKLLAAEGWILEKWGIQTGKCFFDVDHFSGTSLHEAAAFAFGIFPANFAADDSGVFEIAFIASYDFDGRELPAQLSATSYLDALLS